MLQWTVGTEYGKICPYNLIAIVFEGGPEMKKLLSLVITLVLLVCTATAFAETTVSAKTIEAYSLELNTKANTLVVSDRNSGMKYVADTELNPLSEQYGYISPEEGYYEAANEDLHVGLLDGQGKLILPLEYGEIIVLGDRWIAGIRLVVSENAEENPDYRSLFGGNSYMIDTVDLYYAGEKKGTVSRAEWKNAKPFGDYLCIQDREGNQTFYSRDFVKSEATPRYANEYEDDYSTKTITHSGTNQPAFTAGCTLTAQEVQQSIWVNSDKQVLDLQGNVIAELAGCRYASVDSESNLIKIENGDGKRGLADETGKEIVPCLYDSISYALTGALASGYIYAEKDGKSGFVNLTTGAETGFTINKDSGSQRANFIIVDDAREGKILISAAAGELPERYQEANANFPNKGDACRYAVVKGQDGACRVIGQMGEDILPGVTFNSVYDAKISDDGTLILLPGEERGYYNLYTVSYDPDLNAISTNSGSDEDETWTCENGHTGLTSPFCPECGAKKPE